MSSDQDNEPTEPQDEVTRATGEAAEDAEAEDADAVDAEAEARRAEERFIDDLLSRGEAVPEGEELPPGATHEIVSDEQGRRTARRVRFRAY